MQVLAKGRIDVGCEAGCIDALLFLDDFVSALLPAATITGLPALLVRFPLLLL